MALMHDWKISESDKKKLYRRFKRRWQLLHKYKLVKTIYIGFD